MTTYQNHLTCFHYDVYERKLLAFQLFVFLNGFTRHDLAFNVAGLPPMSWGDGSHMVQGASH